MPLNYDRLRSWLFVPAGDPDAVAAASCSGTDVAIAEFEDFTPPARRTAARSALAETLGQWRAAGMVPAVRINPVWTPDGPLDLAAAVQAGAQIIAFPKTRGPEDVVAVEQAIAGLNPERRIDLLPNIESAAALVQTMDIALASECVRSCLVASEDMTTDLQAERTPDGRALRYVRERFLVECRAAGVLPIDAPYTWLDGDGAARETEDARVLGYTAKSAVQADHAAIINQVMTPGPTAIRKAQDIIRAFDDARSLGKDRVVVDGHAVEAPTRANAAALLARADLYATPEEAS